MSMSDYRDIISWNEHDNVWQSANVEVTTPTSQVYQATHDRGGRRLPYLRRSFISFRFGGKNIEDFNFIATITGDTLNRKTTAEFDDITSSYDVLSGQMYHGTVFKANSISFHLTTDGVDELQLEEFKHWFAPGQNRELILSEHPNRAIMARVAEPPELDMMVFEKPLEFDVGGTIYTTSTTMYKGSIDIEFVMDEPFWYSKINIFGIIKDNIFQNQWEDVDFLGSSTDSKNTMKDVLKMVYEDGIPIQNYIDSAMLFGDNLYSAPDTRVIGMVAESISANDYNASSEKGIGYYNNGLTNDDTPNIWFDYLDNNGQLQHAQYYKGAVIEQSALPTCTQGVIFGASIQNTDTLNFTLHANEIQYFYYAGSAPAPFNLEFTLDINVDANGYVSSIYNTYHKSTTTGEPYNIFTFEGEKKQEMKLTTPNFYSSYNKAIFIFRNMKVGSMWEAVRADLRNNVRHSVIRACAINIVNELATSNAIVQETYGNRTAADYTSLLLSQILKTPNGEPQTLSVKINTKTGETLGTINYCQLEFADHTPVFSQDTLKEESIGDMIGSNHLLLQERNYFNSDTKTIIRWDDAHKNCSYRFYHNFPVDLHNVKLTYKYMYY